MKTKKISMPLSGFNLGWREKPDIAIVHYSGGVSIAENFNALESRGLSVHESVERDGTIYKHVSHDNRCIHAGNSSWLGVANVNNRAFGVEVINFGYGKEGTGPEGHISVFPKKELEQGSKFWHRVEKYNLRGKERTYNIITKQDMDKFPDHRNEYKDVKWAKFTDKQVESVNRLIWEWLEYSPNLLIENVVGHEHVAPGRKQDPGPAWPWQKTNEFLEKLAKTHRPELLDVNHRKKDRLKAVQSHLERFRMNIGYIDGVWGSKTDASVKAFIDQYSETYDLGLTHEDAFEDNCYNLANAMKLIPGF